MSTTIDNRVVEMRFDNRQFEQATRETMSTLDKLKEKLNFKSASKNFDAINTSAKKVDMSPMCNSVEKVGLKFNGLYTIADQTLRNITNTVEHAAKNIVSAFTIDPIKTGFQEYETQINAIQTILANTSSKGTGLDDVNQALDTLNKYADKTIYNFTEMTRNIGTFTAAGIDLDTSVNAIQGIANLAAVSGSTSQQASTAMYQLSQALAAGTVKLMDWNSVVNAGMGGEVFQNALKETSRLLGTGVDQAIEATGSFRESLREEWLTAEVLTETLKKMTTTGAVEYLSKHYKVAKEDVEALQKLGDTSGYSSDAFRKQALAIAGNNEELAKTIENTLSMARTSEDAATKVKTFSQLMDTMKESVQSGWTQTWEIILGNFEEAKLLFTEISDAFGAIIQKSADSRNAVLEGALSSKWDKFIKQVNEAGVETEVFNKQLMESYDAMRGDKPSMESLITDHKTLSNVIAKGLIPAEAYADALSKLGDGTEETSKKLADAGQYVVKTGDTLSEIAAKYEMTWQELWEMNKKIISDPDLIYPDQILKLSDAELESLDLTKKEITALRDLSKQAGDSGKTWNEFIDSMSKKSGRELIIDSFRNALTALGQVLDSVKTAWRETFWGNATDDEIIKQKADSLYNLIKHVNSFTESLKMNDKSAENLKKTFKGLFAIVDIFTTVTGGALKTGLNLLCKLFGAADVDILSVTASVGDAIVAFRDWLFESNALARGFNGFIDGAKQCIATVKDWIKAFLEIPEVNQGLAKVEQAFASSFLKIGAKIDEIRYDLTKFVESVKNLDSITLDDVTTIFENFIEMVKGWFDDFDFGIDGIKAALKDFKTNVGKYLGEAGDKFDWLKDKALGFAKFLASKFPAIISIGLGAVLIKAVLKIGDALEVLAGPIKGLSDLLENTAKAIKTFGKSVSKWINAKAFEAKTAGIVNIAKAIAILAGALALLTQLDQGNLRDAAISLTILTAALAALALGLGKLANFGDSIKVSSMLLSLSSSLLMVAAVMKITSGMTPDDIKKGIATIAALEILVMGLVAVSALAGDHVDKAGAMIGKISVALLVLVGVMKLTAGMTPEDLVKGVLTIAALEGLVAGLVAVSYFAGEHADKIGSTIFKISAALLLIVGVMKITAGMTPGDLAKGVLTVAALEGLVMGLIVISKLDEGQSIAKAGGMILGISAGMLILVGVMKLTAKMTPSDLNKGIEAIAGLEVLMMGLIAVTKLAGPHAAKAGAMLLMISGAMLILTGVITILQSIDPDGLWRAVEAISVLEIMFGGLIAITKQAQDCKATLIILTTTITLLSIALIALSQIDSGSLTTATTALSSVIGVFALLIASTKMIDTYDWAKSLAIIGTMTLVVGALSGVIIALSKCEPGSTLETAGALSIILTSLATSCVILSKSGYTIQTAIPAAYAMSGVIAVLGGILVVMTKLNVGSTIEIAESLSILLLSLSGACLILSAVGATGPAALAGVGILSGVIVALGALMISIGALTEHFPILEKFLNEGLPIIEKIGYCLGSFVGNVIGGFASGVTSGLPAIGQNLADFITNAQPFFDGITSVSEEALTGVKNLAEMVLILSAANVIESIGKWLTGGSSMSKFAEELVPFGKAMKGFSEEITGIDGELVANAAMAGKALAEMAATVPNAGGLMAKFFGENDMADFGKKLVPFGRALKDYSKEVAGIDSDSIVNSATAGKALTELASTVPNAGGLLAKFFGENDLADFGAKLVPFGTALRAYSFSVKGLDADAIVNSATAGKALTELASTVPNSGGLMAKFLGDNDIDTFGAKLVTFGHYIKLYSLKVMGLDVGAIVNSTTAGKALVELANTIPNCGGLISIFTGDNDIATFGTSLVSFGESFATYSGHMKNVDAGVVTTTTNAAQSLVELQKGIPKDKWFDGKVTLDEFGEDLAKFGSYFAKYYDKVSGINVSVLSGVIKETKNLVSMAKGMTSFDTSGMSSFAQSLTKLGNAGIDNFIRAFTNANSRVTNAAIGMVNAATNGAKSKQSSFTSTFTTMIQAVLTAINNKQGEFQTAGSMLMVKFIGGVKSKDSTSKSTFTNIISGCLTAIKNKFPDFNDAGETCMARFIKGVESKESSVKKGFTSGLSSAVTAIKEYYSDFYRAGEYLAGGFIAGIDDNIDDAARKAAAMAKAAKEAAEEELDENSPSKEFYNIGNYAGQGFVNGLDSTSKDVSKSGKALAKTAINSTMKELDEHSPSKVFIQIGEYAGEGFVYGIHATIPDAEKSGTELGKSAYESLMDSVEHGTAKLGDVVKTSNDELLRDIQNGLVEVVKLEEISLENRRRLGLDGITADRENHKLSLEEEQAYWDNLLNIRNANAEAEKQQAIDMAAFREETVTKTADILKGYTNELDRNTKSLMNNASIFEEVQEQEEEAITGSGLTQNLRAQVEQMENFGEVLTSLNTRLEDGALKDAINQMGLDSLDELQALNGMTDTELQNYVNLYDQKYALCSQVAATQLSGLQAETEQKLSDLYGGVSINLQQFTQSFDGTFDSIRGYVSESIEIGRQITAGTGEGMIDADALASAKNAATQMITNVVDAAKQAADINSPSGLFRDEVGKYITEGIATGMVNDESLANVQASAETVNKTALETFALAKDQFVTAGSNIIDSYATGINSTSDGVTTAMTTLMSNVVGCIRNAEPSSTSAMSIITNAVIKVVTDKYEEFTLTGSTAMTKFIGGVEAQDNNARTTFDNIVKACLKLIKDKFPEFNTSGEGLMTELISGIKSKLEEINSTCSEMLSGCVSLITAEYDNWFNSGVNLADGFKAGILSKAREIAEAAAEIARDAMDAVDEETDSHSPSREMIRRGRYFGEGFAIGIKDSASTVMSESQTMANGALNTISDTIARISDAVDGNIDAQPTIRPVLDLSNVEAGASRLSAMLSRNQAMSISSSMNRNTDSEIQNGEVGVNKGNTYQFTQNNYSPKALSRVEIYRQTKNQFSAMERMVEA